MLDVRRLNALLSTVRLIPETSETGSDSESSLSALRLRPCSKPHEPQYGAKPSLLDGESVFAKLVLEKLVS